jgi:transcriptional regulator with XRE-family HTH domain
VETEERSIYPNLKLTIYRTGMRQNKLAKLVGIHEAYLSRIVNGTREPGSDLRKSIAAALGADPEWLFEKVKVVPFPKAAPQEDRQAS